MRTHQSKTAWLSGLLLLLTALGCQPGAISGGDSFGGSETGDSGGAGPGVEWAEVRCVEWSDNNPICLARPDGSDDVWAYVTTACELNARVDVGEIIEVAAWGVDSCANGLGPDNMFAEHRCYWIPVAGITTCYSGDGIWFAPDVVTCDPALDDLDPTEPPWPTWSCGAHSSPMVAPWTRVACTVEQAACFAETGNTVQVVRPTCWLDARPESFVPIC